MPTQPSQGHLFSVQAGDRPPGQKPTTLGETAVAYAPAREILTRATGFMDAYDFTLNPYSGCSFGCTYCYAAFFSRDVEKRDSWGYWVNVKETPLSSGETAARRPRR